MKNNEQEELNYSDDEEEDTPTPNPRQKPTKAQTSTSHASTFKDFHLKEELLRGTGEAGFENPSEV
jgi:superfamily II DNA/RNA helicase